MKTRIHLVTTPAGIRLIEAPNTARAIAYVARHEIKAEVISATVAKTLNNQGFKLEVAGDYPVSDETRAALAQELIQA